MKRKLLSLLLVAVLVLSMVPAGLAAEKSGHGSGYYSVTYEWRVYHTDGTFTALPSGAPKEPVTTGGHPAGEQYVYDAEYVTGTSFYDYENGLLYAFHGWDTYSHSKVFNIDPTAVGCYALDDGDTVASNNKTIEITGDTYIYGYWTVTSLLPAHAHIAIEKVFIVDGVEMTMDAATDLWFRVDTGIDRDHDGDTEVDVDYPMIVAANGEYKIPVYQYDTPFVFTEYNAEVPGYTRSTTVTVSGDYISGYSQSGDSVSVSMDPVYVGENVHLGTVTYINSYTKNVGDAVVEYPVLTLTKMATDTGLGQNGVEFTLYSDETCQNFVASVTTAGGGLGHLDFSHVEHVAEGIYYLKETTPVAGYKPEPYVYPVELKACEPVEELRDDEYVMVTYYTLHVTIPEGASGVYQSNLLHLSNEPMLGSLNVRKSIIGLENKEDVKAVVIVHGPILRDADGTITDIGGTWQLDLNAENGWSASLERLKVGEYLLHESFASVHGYTWTDVDYGGFDTLEYNGITSAVVCIEDGAVVDMTLTNCYKLWDATDFYIKKVDPAGRALSGAVFQLYHMVEGELIPADDEDFVTTVTTGADGYAYFSGFVVPEGQTAVTYYLKETKAPDNFYLSDTVYKVEIKAVTKDGTTAYEPHITLQNGDNAPIDTATDLLTVVNYPVLGTLCVRKAFADDTVPEDLLALDVMVEGPDGYIQFVELNAENNWCVVLENLKMGTYTVSEQVASSPGYELRVEYQVGDQISYASAQVELAEHQSGQTVPGTIIHGETTIVNTYIRHEKAYEMPTTLSVVVVGEDGSTPLPGVMFTLYRMDASGEDVMGSISFTTAAEGKVLFDLLSGFVVDGEIVDGVYLLSETVMPSGWEKTDTVWEIRIQEDDGELRVVLNQYEDKFENIWDWIVGDISGDGTAEWTWENNVLTVRCKKAAGDPTDVPQPDNPPTGDVFSLVGWMATVSGAALCFTVLYRKKEEML